MSISKRTLYKDFWKSHDCKYCLYFKDTVKGCLFGEENCFLDAEARRTKSICDGCAYGKSKCVGYCTAISVAEMWKCQVGRRAVKA